MKKIYLISDSTGELGARFSNALMTQFPEDRIQFKAFNFVTEKKDAERLFGKISAKDSVLFHTIIDRKLKKTVQDLSQRKGIAAFDLTGPPTDFLIKHLKARPHWDVSVVHSIDEEYERRIVAIEYAIAHDDGAGTRDLKKADVVLVGPSRSSKTPTGMYLATKGVKVANIPLIRQLGEPESLPSLEGDRRVFAFAISPEKLCEIRQKRSAELGGGASDYVDLAEVRKEVAWARRLYDRYGWQTIDVTERAIEETAALIVKKMRYS